MGVLRKSIFEHVALMFVAATMGGALALLSACSASQTGTPPGEDEPLSVALGESAEHSTEDGLQFSMAVKSNEPAKQCPSRVEPGTMLDGEFQILEVEATFEAAVGDAGAVSMAPDRFELRDEGGTLVGGFNEASTWECFNDDELLPMLALPGQSYAGLVVLEVAPDAVPSAITFAYNDAISFQWEVE